MKKVGDLGWRTLVLRPEEHQPSMQLSQKYLRNTQMSLKNFKDSCLLSELYGLGCNHGLQVRSSI